MTAEIIPIRPPDHAQEARNAKEFKKMVEAIIEKGKKASEKPHRNLFGHTRSGGELDIYQRFRDGKRIVFEVTSFDPSKMHPNLLMVMEDQFGPLENLLVLAERKKDAWMQLSRISVYKPNGGNLGPGITGHSYDGLLRFSAEPAHIIVGRDIDPFCRELVKFTEGRLSEYLTADRT